METKFVPYTYTALTLDNMKEMLDLTWDYRSRWRLIGIQIGIDVGTLDALDKNHKDVEDCLTGLICHWLRGTNPRPTRIAMLEALESSPVAGGAGSAQTTGIYMYIHVVECLSRLCTCSLYVIQYSL